MLTCAASRRGGGIWYVLEALRRCDTFQRGGGIWYVLEALRRCDTFQRGGGGIIAACVGLVSWAVERVQSQKKPLQSPV